MALWDAFTSRISSLGGAKVFAQRLTGGGSTLRDDELEKEKEFHNTMREAISYVDKEIISTTPIGAAAKAVAKSRAVAKTGDYLLQAAVALNNEVLSPYVFRPISTAALLTDTSSPLYQKGQYEEGFQVADIKAAYERSKKVSAFQSLTKSELIPGLGSLSSMVLKNGGIKLDDVNLWDDASIKENYVDNTVGRWFTGIGDFVVGNAALGAAGKVAGIGLKLTGKPLGLYTKKKAIAELESDMNAGILYGNTNGAQGTNTVSGSHVTFLAESKDYGAIADIVEKYSTNGRLINLIHSASTPDAVKDLLLADKGDLGALGRLAATNPDDLFDLSNTAGHLRANFLKSGTTMQPVDEAVVRLKSAYDAAIEKNPQFTKLRDAFFDEKFALTPGGKAYMPLEPIVGASALIKGQEVLRSVKSAARFREFAELKIMSRVGAPATTFIRTMSRGAESLPHGFVTFSGVRPMDGRVELNSFLNNMKLFRNGDESITIAPGVTRNVGDIRRDFENQYMQSIGNNEVAVLNKIDGAIGRMLMYKVGITDEAKIAEHIQKYRSNIDTGMQSLKANGYAIAHDGSSIIPHPVAMSQMADSYRFSPWDSIENQIIHDYRTSEFMAGTDMLANSAHKIFTDLNRLWTFDVLVRPMYITKQSIFEPIISATISQGLGFIIKDVLPANRSGMIGRAANNFWNWEKGKVVYAATASQRKAVERVLIDKYKSYDNAVMMKTMLEEEVKKLLMGKVSPAVKASATLPARKELKAAELLLDKLELDLRAAAVPVGIKNAVPSLATLERRVAFLNTLPKNAKNKTVLDDAQTAIANYKNIIGSMATNKNIIRDADTKLSVAYGAVDDILDELKPILKERADVYGKSTQFKKRYYSKESQMRHLDNGDYVSIDSWMASANPLSASMRAEASNALTADMNLLGEMTRKTRQGILNRQVPMDVIGVTNPGYFAELTHIANRQFRRDALMEQILQGKSMTELTKWGRSAEGNRYLEAFDIYEPKYIAPYIADKVSLVNRMFPSIEARATIFAREIREEELVSMLAPYADELYDIIPANLAYGVADGIGTQGLVNLVNNTAARMYRFMSSAENPIRNAFFENVATDAVARKLNDLIAQGIKPTTNQINALRQSAGREAIQELEKTIYSIRRQNRLLHSLRVGFAFPTATVNAFSRYGRLAVKHPVRMTGFASNYGKLFQNFGVDENGNPTDDIHSITHIILPGTKDLGLGYMGEGIGLNARSIGFILNQPSPSFVTSLSIGNIMKYKPNTEEGIKAVMNLGGADLYEKWFPYGAQSDIVTVFTPPWLKSLTVSMTGDESQKDWLASYNSVYNYHKMLVDNNVEKTFPSDEKIRLEVKNLWLAKAFAGWASMAGVPYKVETNPMRLATNLYYRSYDKYKAQGYSDQDSRDGAGNDILQTLGADFMVDRITSTNKGDSVSGPATYEAYSRVFKDNNELVAQLSAIDSKDSALVDLLTADMTKDSNTESPNMAKILSDPNLRLPGTSKLVNTPRLTPQEAEAKRLKSRTWEQYMMVKEALTAKITDGKSLRSHPELTAALDGIVEEFFKPQSQAWYDDYKMAANGDKSYKYARALTTIVNDKKWMDAHGDSQYYKDAATFMRARSIFVQFYQSLPDYDKRKASIKDEYNDWVAEGIKQWDPAFAKTVDFYFDNDQLKAVD